MQPFSLKCKIKYTYKFLLFGYSRIIYIFALFLRPYYYSGYWNIYIFIRGVYLTSCLLWFKLRNFDIKKEDKATVDVYEMCVRMLHLL